MAGWYWLGSWRWAASFGKLLLPWIFRLNLLKRKLHFQKHINCGEDDIMASGWHWVSFEIYEHDWSEARSWQGEIKSPYVLGAVDPDLSDSLIGPCSTMFWASPGALKARHYGPLVTCQSRHLWSNMHIRPPLKGAGIGCSKLGCVHRSWVTVETSNSGSYLVPSSLFSSCLLWQLLLSPQQTHTELATRYLPSACRAPALMILLMSVRSALITSSFLVYWYLWGFFFNLFLVHPSYRFLNFVNLFKEPRFGFVFSTVVLYSVISAILLFPSFFLGWVYLCSLIPSSSWWNFDLFRPFLYSNISIPLLM